MIIVNATGVNLNRNDLRCDANSFLDEKNEVAYTIAVLIEHSVKLFGVSALFPRE